MGLKSSKILKSILAATVLALGLLISGLVPINLSFVKSTIEQHVRENLDLDVTFQGPLRLRLGAKPRVDGAAIEIRKLGAVNEVLARVDAVSLSPHLIEILRGRIHVESLHIAGVEFDYCAELPALGNDETSAKPLPSIAANDLTATNLQLYCGTPGDEQTLKVVVEELNGSAAANESMSATVRGRVNDLSIELEAHAGTLNALLASPDSFPLQLSVASHDAEFHLEGVINDPLDRLELRADTSLRAKNAQSLLSKLGMSIPELPEIEFSSEVWLDDGTFGIESLVGKLGSTAIDARGLARFSLERNYYELDVHLDRLQAGLFGSGSVMPEENNDMEAYDLQPLFNTLREFDGDIQVTADQLTNGVVRLDNLALEASLSDGNLVLSRYQMHLMGSPFEGEARLDLNSECANFRAGGRATGVDLKQLATVLGTNFAVPGNLDRIEFEIESCGNTLIEHRNSVVANVDALGATINLESIEKPIYLETLKVNTGWARPSRAVFHGNLLDEKLSADVQGGSIEELATGAPWPISIEMAGPGVSMNLEGRAAIAPDSAFVDVHVGIDAPHVGSLHRWTIVDPGNELPLSASVSIRWGNDGILINGLNASLGHSSVEGRFESFDGETEPVLVAELRSSGLNLTELNSVRLPMEKPGQPSLQANQASGDFDFFEFHLGLDLPTIDLDLRIERLDGVDFEIRDVVFRGNIGNQQIDNANLSMRVDDNLFAGTFDLDVRNSPGTVSYQGTVTNLDIGGLLHKLDLVDDTDITADQVNLDYSSHGRTLREMAVNGETRAEIQNFRWLAEKQDEERIIDLDIARLALTLAPGQPTGWEAYGLLNGVPLQAWARTAALEEILDGENKSSLTIVANSGDNFAMLNGNVDWSAPDSVSGDLVLSGERMDPEVVDFGQLQSPLKGFELRTDVIINNREISATNLRASIGASHTTGYARYDAGQNGNEFEVKLQAPHVQTDDFVRLTDAWRNNRQGDEIVGADLSADPEARVFVDIIQGFIEQLTREHSFDIQIGVDALYAGSQHMGTVELGMLADENNFRLEPIKMTLPGGDINAEYVVEKTADGVDMRLNIYVERLDYGDLLRLIDPNVREDAGGYLYVDTSLTSSASTTARLASAVQGDVALMIIPEDAAAGVLDLWAASLVLAVLPTPEGQNDRKKLNCMVAGFSADEGVLHSDIVLLDATQVIVRGKGTIDIADQTLDMFVAPQAKREKFFSMSTPVTITGSWDDFRIGVARGGITATLFRWYMALIYVPFKWLTGERFPADGLATCFNATQWDMPTESD